jgi:hypothetical protein
MSGDNDKSVRIEFPEDTIEIVEKWASSMERGVGVCLLCGSVIHTEAEFIPGTSTHDCPVGRSLEQSERHA